MTSSPRKSLAVILNRESGTLANLGPSLVEDELKSLFEGLGCEVSIRNLPGKEVSAAIKEARDGDAEAVIVGGGDGTVAAAATILSGQSKPLGILPLGTFNLAARDVGMPLDWREAAEWLVSAPAGEMDLLDVDGKLFLCVVVLGFYPSLAMGQPEYHGNWIIKSFRTLFQTLRGVAMYPPLHLQFTSDGTVQVHRTRMALMANNDYEDMFGLIPKRSSLDAGYFTVYISKHDSAWGLFRSVVSWILGKWKQDREITVIRATDLEIDVKRKRRVAAMMDGELERLTLPVRVKLRPKALWVIAPRLKPTPESHSPS